MSTGFLWDERYAWHDTGTGAGFMSARAALVEPETHGGRSRTKAARVSLRDSRRGLLGRRRGAASRHQGRTAPDGGAASTRPRAES